MATLTHADLSSAKNWCSDSLHELLGFADSALAGFLVDVASSNGRGGNKKKRSGNDDGRSVQRVMQTLREGGVTGDDGRLLNFSRELCRRCGGAAGPAAASLSTAAAASTASGGGRPVTNAEMMKRAANYSLMEMEEPEVKIPPKKSKKGGNSTANESVPGTIVTKSSRGSHKDGKRGDVKSSRFKDDRKSRDRSRDNGKEDRKNRERISRDSDKEKYKKDDRRKLRRRRRSSSSSSSDDEEAAVIDDEELWKRRERRREELRETRGKKSNEGRGDSNDEGGRDTRDRSKLTVEERADMERERDIRERDEFAKRLNQNDKQNQKSKLGRDHSDDDSYSGSDVDKKESEAQNRMERLRKREERDHRLARGEEVVLDDSDDDGDNPNRKKKAISIQDMRAESRRAYLQKRTKRELELLERELADEEDLIAKVGGSHSLTKEEERELQLKRDILRMAREHGHVDGDEAEAAKKPDGFYRLPDEFDGDNEEHKGKSRAQRGEELLTSRYVEPKQEKSEQQLWEEGQTQMAAGLSRHKKRHKDKKGSEEEDDEDKYDFVFEEQQIDFVCMDTKKGYDHRNKNKKRHPSKQYEEEEESVKEDEKVLEMRPATKHEKILEGRKKLPVYPYREEFLSALQEHQVLILVGETGSGKTTQIPQYLHEVGYSELGKIGCTQPRRVAAMSVAARVAEEMDVRVGHEVGYSIRFENCTSKKTVIQYMTDGMLLREFLTEPDLKSYSCLVIDEAHERTLHTDILFGLVKDVARFRDDLKLVISSATLDAEKFSKYFDDASIFMIPGRMYPVDIYYTKAPEADYVDAAIVTVLQIHISQPLDGDILVFLTGQEEIETANEILAHRSRVLGNKIAELILCPIYANLPSEQQAKIFEDTPKEARKIVLATNIAETSLTINGIKYVIDTGFNKETNFTAKTGMESLMVMPISQAAANQRAGRAGRTQPGKCFRLFTAHSFQHELDPNTTPEILRTNMCNVVLMLKSLGIDNLLAFDFMDAPPPDTLIRALEQLYALGALNDRGELTKMGRRMAEFPLDPMLSKTVIVSEKYKCVSEVLSTVSMLSIGSSVFYRPKEKKVHADTARQNFARGGGGDHIALLRCYREWAETDYSPQWCFENYVQVRNMRKARDVREQLEGLCERVEVDPNISSPDDIESTLKSVCAGFFYNTARLGRSGDYETVKQRRTVHIHPSSVLAKEEPLPGWVLYFELAFTSKEYMRQVAPIEPKWLTEIAPHYYQESDVEDSKTKKMPKGKEVKRNQS
eukprot:CAMPEP_0172531752 /NCGR_PEP_ID=MMETSP1067-20121228/5018_1 /TAXON_ID=265564 ORGANISM="Thalassiosira punctigera, Strain Tpunct2005C2" /NCGR_SAMPLE_ID=MMETSP1067 /ASSEMBLY_ACC=CAM_ASM_000444 /LENGTH=1263 /DNA_ID=CAMNT_0013316155 /DNA_START=46 /DNA_END=3837 /DNA_ORIENTATION=-